MTESYNLDREVVVTDPTDKSQLIKWIKMAVCVVILTLIAGGIAAAIIIALDDDETFKNHRLRCPVKGIVTKESCEARGCNFAAVDAPLPQCTFNLEDICYHVSGDQQVNDTVMYLPLKWKSNKKKQFEQFKLIEEVAFEVFYVNSKTVRIKLKDSRRSRFEVPIELNTSFSDAGSFKANYELKVNNKLGEDFDFKLMRRGVASRTLLDTSLGGLMLSDHFLQIATFLNTKNVYGIGHGGHHFDGDSNAKKLISLRRKFNYEVHELFARSEPDMTTVHPFLMAIESDGKAHGLLFFNSNPMEMELLPEPGLVIRTSGGVLDLLIFVGDSPNEVVSLMSEVIGRSVLPPMWSLGLNMMANSSSGMSSVKDSLNSIRSANIPIDAISFNRDYMDMKRTLTFDAVKFKELSDFMKDEQKKGINFVFLMEPDLEANAELKQVRAAQSAEAFIRWPQDTPITNRTDPPGVSSSSFADAIIGIGKGSNPIVYLDFFKNSTRNFWSTSLVELSQELGFNGLELDANQLTNYGTAGRKLNHCGRSGSEPCFLSNCSNNEFDEPFFKLTSYANRRQSESTICLNAKLGEGSKYNHFDVHNIFSWSQSKATIKALRQASGERGFLISKSTYTSIGSYAGHLIAVNNSWTGLRNSIVSAIELSMFGVPLVGLDVGSAFELKSSSSKREVCIKSIQAASLMPLIRSAIVMSELYLIRVALNERYKLLPYMYTKFYSSKKFGHPVVRGMFLEFPKDSKCLDIDGQFMLGSDLLIAPVLEPDKKEWSVYMPKGLWFDYYHGDQHRSDGEHVIWMNVTVVPVFAKSGSIIPVFDLEPLKNNSINADAW